MNYTPEELERIINQLDAGAAMFDEQHPASARQFAGAKALRQLVSKLEDRELDIKMAGEAMASLQSRLDSLQAGVRNYLNATELDENGPAWYLLHGALANSSAPQP